MDTPRGFQDLKCWQEARRLYADCARLVCPADSGSTASSILYRRILRISSHMSESIAAAYSKREQSGFAKGLKGVLKQSRRLESILYSAEDTGLISSEESGALRKGTRAVVEAVKEHIRYLMNQEIKRIYREMEEL